ncbi:MAG TPA: tail fiber protein [Stellaceae bacterium]|nr:tail fiber protein [Stellaceae bacterium]
MTVAQFLQTNYTTQTGTAYPLAIDADWAVAARLIDNFAPHAQPAPDMTVALDAGHFFNGAALTEVAAQGTGAITAPVANPRIDRVVVDRVTGAVSVVTGTEAASPVPPAIPAGKAPVAQVLLQTTSTAIANSMLTDERDLASLGLASGAYATVGTAATQNVGTSAGDVVQLDASGRLPAVDGSQLTGLGAVPSGVVVPFAGASAPAGWLLCYGQAVSRTTYAALFTAIGTTFGSGDGSTTFNLPDLRGRAAFGVDNMGGTAANRVTTGGSGINGSALGAVGGAEIVTLTQAQMPSHSHSYIEVSGTTTAGGSCQLAPFTSTAGSSTGNAGSGGAHNNMPPAIMLNSIIKT